VKKLESQAGSLDTQFSLSTSETNSGKLPTSAPISGTDSALGPVTAGIPPRILRPRVSREPRAATLSKPGVVQSATPSPEFSFHLKPAEIARHLDRFVIGQKEAKKVLSVALCDHFQHVRLTLEGQSAPFYQKQNVLLLGPTGVGKTHLIRSAAELIGVPFVKADATKFSETGYVGGDVDDLVRDLVRRAGGSVKKAENGIIYLDEVDKLATREPGSGRDVSGRGVQTNLLKLMEDGDVPLVSPNDMTGQLQAAMSAMRGGGAGQPEIINTRHILFIVSGAFSGIDGLVRRRLMSGETGSKLGRVTADQLISQVTTADIIMYGLEPEFIGRLPVRVACHGLDTDDLFNVLRKSESSLIHQYERAFKAYGIELEFRDDGLRRLAERAAVEQTGARGLMTVCEQVFRDFKFRLPSTRVKKFALTAQLVDNPPAELRRLISKANG
jgi:ATP-dependent Clp protease ATP-binding subunit ClpX